MNPYLFRFEFSSRYNRIRNMNYVVYAETKEALNMFLIQHNFTDSPLDAVTIIPKSSLTTSVYQQTLQEHLFKSNHSDELFTVMTCPQFVEQAIETTCNDLNDCLLFGEAIITRSIGIFELIGDLVHKLPHVNILDFALADKDSIEQTSMEIDSFIETLSYEDEYNEKYGITADPSTYYLHQSMFNIRSDGEPEPITIEAYTSYFTEMITDVFE